MKKTIGFLVVITVFSKILGLVRETLLAYYFGTSEIVDMFVLATAIPSVIFGCLDAVAVVIVPIYIKKKVISQKTASQTFNNVLSWTAIISIIVLFLLEIVASKVSSLFWDVNDNNFELFLIFIRITLFTVVFNPIQQMYLALLRCENKQVKAQLVELSFSGTQIVFIVFAGVCSKSFLLPVGYVFAHLSCMMFSYFASKSKFVVNLDFTESVKESFKMVMPTFFSNVVVQLNAFIDKLFAASLTIGLVAALNYSNILKNLIYAIFTAPIVSLFYPRIAYFVARDERETAKKVLYKIVCGMLAFLFPCVLFSYIFSDEIISLLFLRGEFDVESLKNTSDAYKMYAIGIIPICLKEVFFRCYYSVGKNKKLLFINVLNTVINIIFNILLIDKLGHIGLALGTSVSSICTLPFLIYGLNRENLIELNGILKTLLKCLMYAVIPFFILVIYKKNMMFPDSCLMQILYIVFAVCALFITYLPFIYKLVKVNIFKNKYIEEVNNEEI